jgi:hypothetical protein
MWVNLTRRLGVRFSVEPKARDATRAEAPAEVGHAEPAL